MTLPFCPLPNIGPVHQELVCTASQSSGQPAYRHNATSFCRPLCALLLLQVLSGVKERSMMLPRFWKEKGEGDPVMIHMGATWGVIAGGPVVTHVDAIGL